MKTIAWKESRVGAELVENDPTREKKEKVLGAVAIENGYCFPWAYNVYGNQIHLPCLFAEKVEQAKSSVIGYLTKIGIIYQTPTPQDEKAACAPGAFCHRIGGPHHLYCNWP